MQTLGVRILRLGIALWAMSTPSVFANAESAAGCELAPRKLKELTSKIEREEKSLAKFTGEPGQAELDIFALFQVDLQKPVQIKSRIEQLTGEANTPNAFGPEYEQLATCLPKDSELKELAERQAILDSKKLKMLKLPAAALLEKIRAYEDERQERESSGLMGKELRRSSKAIESAAENLRKSEVLAAENDDTDSVPSRSAQLQAKKLELETDQLEFVADLQKKSELLSQLHLDLKQTVNRGAKEEAAEVANAFQAVSLVWRAAGSSLLELYRELNLRIQSESPELLRTVPLEESARPAYDAYAAEFESYRIRRVDIAATRVKLANELKAQNFKLLKDSGEQRARLHELCDQIDCERDRGFTKQNFLDLRLELKLVPLKLLAGSLSKWLEVRTKLGSGAEGWLDLVKQFIVLCGLLLVPVLFAWLLRTASESLNRLRKNLLARSMLDYRRRTSLAMWITRINPFLPFIGMIAALEVSRGLISNTDLRDFSLLIFYAEVYYFYRAARLLLSIGLQIIFSDVSIDLPQEQKEKIEASARRVSGLVFAEFLLLHLTEDAVRRVIAYGIFSNVIFWLNVAVLFYESHLWKKEVLEAFSERLPKQLSFSNWLAGSRWGTLLIPALFLFLAIHDGVKMLIIQVSRFDLFKKLSSEVLRQRLKRVEKSAPNSEHPPPLEYLQAFDFYRPAAPEFYVAPEEATAAEVVGICRGWLTGTTTKDLVILIGDRGMGKTTTLEEVNRKLNPDTRVTMLGFEGRICQPADFFSWLSRAMGATVESVQCVIELDRAATHKKVILVDDIHNLFLSASGSFEAYRLFQEVVGLPTTNIFWCLSVNSRSWAYLKGVFGKEHFYGREIKLAPMREMQIRELILRRHAVTKFSRSFDDSIKAYGAGDALGAQAETQFFRLLWGQSRGNPRSALMYWITALTSPNDTEVHVGVPSFINSNLVASMSDDALFLLAAIARHENLTLDELTSVTRISDLVIKKCIKEAQDKSLVWLDAAGRIRINSRAQYVVDYFLIGKNFLYE